MDEEESIASMCWLPANYAFNLSLPSWGMIFKIIFILLSVKGKQAMGLCDIHLIKNSMVTHLRLQS